MTLNAKKYFDARQMESNRLALVAIAAQDKRKRAWRVALGVSFALALVAASASYALVSFALSFSIFG